MYHAGRIRGKLRFTTEGDRDSSSEKDQNQPEIELNDASVKSHSTEITTHFPLSYLALTNYLRSSPAQSFDLAVGEFDAVGEDAQYEVVEGGGEIGALAAHLFEIDSGQGEDDGRAVRRDGGRARRLPEEAHLAEDGLRLDAPHKQAAAIALRDVDREFAGGDEIESVGGLALTVENLRIRDILAFEVGQQIGGCDAAAELALQPRFEAGETAIGVEAGLGEQLILAPGERGVEVDEGLVAALASEETTPLEGGAVSR